MLRVRHGKVAAENSEIVHAKSDAHGGAGLTRTRIEHARRLFQESVEQDGAEPGRPILRRDDEIDRVSPGKLSAIRRDAVERDVAKLRDNLIAVDHQPQGISPGVVGRIVEELPAQVIEGQEDVVGVLIA